MLSISSKNCFAFVLFTRCFRCYNLGINILIVVVHTPFAFCWRKYIFLNIYGVNILFYVYILYIYFFIGNKNHISWHVFHGVPWKRKSQTINKRNGVNGHKFGPSTKDLMLCWRKCFDLLSPSFLQCSRSWSCKWLEKGYISRLCVLIRQFSPGTTLCR